eukprot:2147457-Pyramimonas_sp.AAC.1
MARSLRRSMEVHRRPGFRLQGHHGHPCQRHDGPTIQTESQRPLLGQQPTARRGHDGPQEVYTTFP